MRRCPIEIAILSVILAVAARAQERLPAIPDATNDAVVLSGTDDRPLDPQEHPQQYPQQRAHEIARPGARPRETGGAGIPESQDDKPLPSADLSGNMRESASLREHSCGRNSVVECQLPKLDVEGSNPFARYVVTTEPNAI